MLNFMNDTFEAVVIVLLVFDIFSRFNSSYWFRKGFDAGMKVLTDAVVDVTNKMQKK